MASIGYLLLHWGQLERRLAGGPIPDELQDVRQLRNDLCHGLHTARADPTDDGEPFVSCESVQRGAVRYTWTDLDQAIRTLEGFNGRAAAATGSVQ
ncbi:hypothetical protein [Phenylobacterium sp.]|uniref:hypothetical protein n=1 Tax=Phenylobacterium sp. TaxID=1871053 RepID=UPI003566518C